ncbi:MAG: reductase, partial [Burkholderiaceae bacterium]|nr:reductase [Burkholderiaceae bacterium]
LRRCQAEGVEAVVLVPNCPVCHQTLSLVARYLEAAGISTVLLACAKDIVEYCGVPRAMFSDFPLGNAAGKPNDPASQAATLELAFRTLESAPAARTTVQSPQRWSASHAWKQDYSNVARVSPQEFARLRSENDRAKEAAKALRADQLS